jgi:hypothetical protein
MEIKRDGGQIMAAQKGQRAVMVASVAWLGVVMAVQGAFAQVPFPRPERTKNFDVKMVRAMDACTAPTLTVTDAGMPAAACPQTNSITDDVLTMENAKLRLTRSGKIRLLGKGFTVGDTLRLRLILRVTQQNVTTNMGLQTVTFQDVTVDCPPAPDAIPVKLNGSISSGFELGACLSPTSGLQLGNIEILEARLLNTGNGRAVAAPGVVHQ